MAWYWTYHRKTERMWMDEEDAHLEEQNSDGLVKKFNSMLKESSSVYFDVDQLEVIIDHYLERSKPKSAERAVEHGLTLFENNNFLLLRKGQIKISLGEFEQGRKILLNLLKSDPVNQELLFGIGMSYAQIRDSENAVFYYKKAYDHADDDLRVEILVELALQYQILDKVDFSLKCYQKAISYKNQSDLVLRELSSCVKRANKALEGIRLLTEILDKDPYYHQAWFHLGMLHSELKNYKEAVECFDFATAIKEDYAIVYYKKAETQIKEENYKGALQSLKEEMKYREPIALSYCIMADCYEHLDQFDQAELHYLKALDLDDSFSEAYIGLGFLKEIQFDYLGSLPFYRKAVQLEPENYNAHLMLSSALTELDRIEESKAVIRNLLSIEEGLEEAWIELGFIYASEGDLEKAISIVEEGIETAFSNEQLWLKKVVYLHKFGKRKEALELARELLIEDESVKVTLVASGSSLLEDPEMVLLLNEFS